jgi:S-adenosylmethionine:tRNA ribosyltransferase-isomerase
VKLSDFDFRLPDARIAQTPCDRRDGSLLMVPGRDGTPSRHLVFRDLQDLLRPEDLLVLNDTRVIPARLYGYRPSGGRVELLLLERVSTGVKAEDWECMLKSGRKPDIGEQLEIDGGIVAEIVENAGRIRKVRLTCSTRPLRDALAAVGHMPLPPYIRRSPTDEALRLEDLSRYQTVFSKSEGAVAAPTAGLHFSDELLKNITDAGVRTTCLTLHVGIGTFLPVEEEDLDLHVMHEERFTLPADTVQAVQDTRRAGGRVVAVGTTVVRTLEGCAGADGALVAGEGRCNLFIRPGFRFKVVDAMITNFHLPRSTLLMLVSAFAGKDRILRAYQEAIERDYRFYSYGDAMFLTP